VDIKENRKKHAPGVKGADLANHPAIGHPAIGIWADREDMKDLHAWLKKILTPRYLRDGGSLSSPPPQKSRRSPKS
jgi:hypothetical protein